MASPKASAAEPPALYLRRWHAWQPGRDRPGDERIITLEKPAAACVPAMLRRRLTPMGRAVCEMLDALALTGREVPVLHASRHGDGHRPLDMLDTLAEGEPLSPARFGLSVHNAVLGVYSIALDNRVAMAALAAAGEEFEALLSEARGYLAEGSDAVALVLSDSPVPARYRIGDLAPERPSAVALEISLEPAGSLWRLIPSDAEGEPRAPVTPPRVTDWLTGGAPLVSAAPPTRWTLAPVPGRGPV